MKKKPKEITMFDIYKAVMQTDEIHFFDVHQNPNDECIVGQNIKPILTDIFKEMEKKIEMELSKITLDDCINIMREKIK